MKIRTGFVSNSSSSSFLLITTKDKHDLALEKMDADPTEAENAAFVRKIVGFKKMGGTELAIVHVEYGDVSTNYLYETKGFDNSPSRFKTGPQEDYLEAGGSYSAGVALESYADRLEELGAEIIEDSERDI